MLHAATRPRSLLLLAAALAVATLFGWLGDWQLQRSREEAEARAAQQARDEQAVAELTDVLAPATAVTADVVGRRVRVTGRYDAAGQLLASAPDGGVWTLAPLLVDTPSGPARLPVVRGALPAGAAPGDVPAPPDGEVTVTGRLEAGDAPVGLPPDAGVGVVDGVSPADLANLWGPPVWTAYLVVTGPAPPAPLTPVPEPDRGGSGFDLQNLSYALQWWVFAGFAVLVWWRLVRETQQREAQQRATGPGEAPGPGTAQREPRRPATAPGGGPAAPARPAAGEDGDVDTVTGPPRAGERSADAGRPR